MKNIKHWPIGKKLQVGFACVVLILMVISGVSLYQILSIGHDFDEVALKALPFERESLKIEKWVGDQKLALSRFLRNPTETHKKEFEHAGVSIEKSAKILHDLARNEAEKKAVGHLEKEIKEMEFLGLEAMKLEEEMEHHYHIISKDVDIAFNLLENEMQSHLPEFNGDKLHYQNITMHMESDLKALMYNLTLFLLHQKSEDKLKFLAMEDELDKLEEEYEHLALTEEEKLWGVKLKALFKEIKMETVVLLSSFEKSGEDFEHYLKVSDELDKTVETELITYIEKIIERDIEHVHHAVSSAKIES